MAMAIRMRWNEDATEQMIADSNLTLDAFPMTPTKNWCSKRSRRHWQQCRYRRRQRRLERYRRNRESTDPFNRDSDGDVSADGDDWDPWTTAIIGIPTATAIGDLTDNDDDTRRDTQARICSHGQRTTATYKFVVTSPTMPFGLVHLHGRRGR